MIHRKKNDLLYDLSVCHRSGRVNIPVMVNRLKIPQGLSTLLFVGGVKFPRGEGSAVIHRKKNRPAVQRGHPTCVLVLSFFFLFSF